MAEDNVHFRIYYSDESYYEGPPELAPGRDVQAIVQDHRTVGSEILSGSDYFVWSDRGDGYRWWGVDLFGLYDYLVEDGLKIVLFGRMLAFEEWNRIFSIAAAYKDKKSFLPRERKPDGPTE